jgi:hypothetical protein
VNVTRRGLAIAATGLLASQAGHLLAYSLRFGAAAQQVQSSGAHAYFPTLAKTGLGLLALLLVAGLFVVGLGRVIAGRLEIESAPPYVRLLAALFTLQLAAFITQETLESAVAGSPSGPAEALLLWGTIGQLPVAAVAALGLRWLLTRLRPALAAIRWRTELIFQPPVHVLVLQPVPVTARVAAGGDRRFDFSRRGPPN